MIRCLSCKKDNEDNITTCKHCGTRLPDGMNERKIFSIDEIVKLKMPDVMKTFSIKGFLEENHRLFTILGIFAALSYYLISLASKTNECDVFSLMSKVNNATITTNTEILSSELLGLPSDIFLEFGILLSYLVFVVIFIILLVETLKYDKNFQRSLFIYCLCFLCAIVILYSISILQTVIPFFIFITIIYGCGLLFSYLYDFILSRVNNEVISSWVVLSIPSIIFANLLISALLLSGISFFTSNGRSFYPQENFGLNIAALALLGLIIGIFLIGTFIIMIRYIKDIFTYRSSFRCICIIVVVLLFFGALIAYSNVYNIRYFGIDMCFIGCVIIVSMIIDKIRRKYSLKI